MYAFISPTLLMKPDWAGLIYLYKVWNKVKLWKTGENKKLEFKVKEKEWKGKPHYSCKDGSN